MYSTDGGGIRDDNTKAIHGGNSRRWIALDHGPAPLSAFRLNPLAEESRSTRQLPYLRVQILDLRLVVPTTPFRENLALVRRIDELFLKYPFQRELVRQSREGEGIGRARAD